jgi:hypothetical protein
MHNISFFNQLTAKETYLRNFEKLEFYNFKDNLGNYYIQSITNFVKLGEGGEQGPLLIIQSTTILLVSSKFSYFSFCLFLRVIFCFCDYGYWASTIQPRSSCENIPACGASSGGNRATVPGTVTC